MDLNSDIQKEKQSNECKPRLLVNEGIPKDSKRSWLVCLGAVFLVGSSLGIANSFGVLFVSWTQEFKESRTEIAWVASFHFIWYMGLCPLCGILTRYYTFRPVVFLGSVLLCLGLLLSSFVKDIPVFYITYGMIFGTGSCLLYMSGIIVLPYCFQRHLGIATGLAASANCGFAMWCGPVYEYIIRHYGWRVSLRIVAAVFFLPLTVSCALFPSRKQIPSEKKTGDFKVGASFYRLIKNKGFLTWLLLMTLVYLAIFIPMIHLVSFCKDIGIPTYISVYNVTLMYGAETLGKVLSGKLIDALNWNVHTYNILSLLTLAVSITLLPLAKTTAHMLTFAVFYGFGVGVQSVCVIMITPELCHPDDAKHAVTYLFGALSIPGGVGPVLAAWIFDVTRSYHLAFFIAGGFFAFAACLATLIQLLASRNVSISYKTVELTTPNGAITKRTRRFGNKLR